MGPKVGFNSPVCDNSGCCSSHGGISTYPDGLPVIHPATGALVCEDGALSPTCRSDFSQIGFRLNSEIYGNEAEDLAYPIGALTGSVVPRLEYLVRNWEDNPRYEELEGLITSAMRITDSQLLSLEASGVVIIEKKSQRGLISFEVNSEILKRVGNILEFIGLARVTEKGVRETLSSSRVDPDGWHPSELYFSRQVGSD